MSGYVNAYICINLFNSTARGSVASSTRSLRVGYSATGSEFMYGEAYRDVPDGYLRKNVWLTSHLYSIVPRMTT